MSGPIYALGDIHGQLHDLKRVHDWIARDRIRSGCETAPVVHLGDLIDRGPDSRGVIEYLLQGQKAGQPWIVLKGNHDRFLQKFIEDPDWGDPRLRPDYDWMHPNMGGHQTLASYGIDPPEGQPLSHLPNSARAKIPAAHIAFLTGLPLYLRHGDVVFVHAGIRPGKPMPEQTEDDLLWMRQPVFTEFSGDFGFLLIHGHTMVPNVTHFGNRVDIDTGAGRGDPISAIVVNGTKVEILERNTRRPLPSPW